MADETSNNQGQDVKGLFGQLVGAAILVPYGIRTFSHDDIRGKLHDISFQIVELLQEETLVTICRNEDPYYHGLLYRGPEDTAEPGRTPYPGIYETAPEAMQQKMMAWAVISNAAYVYILDVKGDLPES